MSTWILKDPFDTGRIISDEKLKELFEVDAFNGLAVTKLLKSHFVKAEKWVPLDTLCQQFEEILHGDQDHSLWFCISVSF